MTTRGGGKWKRFGVTQSKHGDRDPLANHFRQKRKYIYDYQSFLKCEICCERETPERTLGNLAWQTEISRNKEFLQIKASCVIALGLLSLTKDGDIRAETTFILEMVVAPLFVSCEMTHMRLFFVQ